jgi:hypothetical protein
MPGHNFLSLGCKTGYAENRRAACLGCKTGSRRTFRKPTCYWFLRLYIIMGLYSSFKHTEQNVNFLSQNFLAMPC